MISNAASMVRDRISRLFPFAYGGNAKHNYYADYGYPEQLTFEHFYRMYTRGGLATAAVDKTIGKTWETAPALWESEKPAESQTETDIRKHFTKRNIWRGLMNADRRGMVGAYSAAIILVRDGKALDQPVGRTSKGIEAINGIIPAWQGQISVVEWDTNPASEFYGDPIAYQYDEQAVGDTDNKVGRGSVRIHPDRVLIFSEDGTVNGRSTLEPGYNDLLDAEKIKGAGGEGFWKSARGAPIIEAPVGVTPQDIARNMGVNSNAEIIDKINEQVDDFQSGFDKMLMLGAFTAKPLNIVLPQPKEFWDTAVMSFAASMGMPFKILVGNVTGERASTEDANEWAQTNMGRRANLVVPVLNEFVRRLIAWGILPEGDWTIGWQDLAEASPDDKMDRAGKMATMNNNPLGEPIFLPDEIREAAGYAPSEDVEGWDEFMAERDEKAKQAAEDAQSMKDDVPDDEVKA